MDTVVWKSCGRKVETLWIVRHEKKIRATTTPELHAQSAYAGIFARRFACGGETLMRQFRPHWATRLPPGDLNVNVHRYEEHIAGRTYLIEVRPITESRWRAQIARLPGMPTALMPFYGPTPEEAARELSRWLLLVYNGCTTQ